MATCLVGLGLYLVSD